MIKRSIPALLSVLLLMFPASCSEKPTDPAADGPPPG